MEYPEPTQRTGNLLRIYCKEIRGEQKPKTYSLSFRSISPEAGLHLAEFLNLTYEKPKLIAAYHKPQSLTLLEELHYPKPVSSMKASTTYLVESL